MMFVQRIYLFHHGGKSNSRCEEAFNLEIIASRYDTKEFILFGIWEAVMFYQTWLAMLLWWSKCTNLTLTLPYAEMPWMAPLPRFVHSLALLPSSCPHSAARNDMRCILIANRSCRLILPNQPSLSSSSSARGGFHCPPSVTTVETLLKQSEHLSAIYYFKSFIHSLCSCENNLGVV